MFSFKNISLFLMIVVMMINGGQTIGQVDDRFGVAGREGTTHLGLPWYRDWNDFYLAKNYPLPGQHKIWTVGKIDHRSDGLGIDWRWFLLELLEDTDINLLDNFMNLCLAVVDEFLLPVIDGYWSASKPILETELENTVDQYVFTDMISRIKYRGRFKYTSISFQDQLPEFHLTVEDGIIKFDTSLSADWKTHIFVEAWVLNPNPFNWGYHWKNIGDADGHFKTIITINGEIALQGQGRDRHLQVTKIASDSQTESAIDWSLLGISFNWENLSNSVEDAVDENIEKSLNQELNKEPITSPYYLVDYFKSLFDDKIVPTQQEILDNIFKAESRYISRVIEKEGFRRQYWSVGYEPNWFPLLEPEQYADYYTKYYRLIKGADRQASVLGPSIFLTEAIENPGEIVLNMIPDMFQGLLEGVEDEFKNFISSYSQKTDSKTWYNAFLAHLPEDVRVDINDLHIFPMNAEDIHPDWDQLIPLIDNMAEFMKDASRAEQLWVTEFGNIDWRRSEADVAAMCGDFCRYFRSNSAGIGRWFWYRAYGHAPFFNLPIGTQPAMTALLYDDYTISEIGKVYIAEATGAYPVNPLAHIDDVASAVVQLPTSFGISQNYPNPFNPITRMTYQLPVAGRVVIRIYNTGGQLVRVLIDADQGAGYYEVEWDGSDDRGERVGSGIYFYRMDAGDQWVVTKKMILAK